MDYLFAVFCSVFRDQFNTILLVFSLLSLGIGDMSGMINLTVLTTALQVSGIFFVFLLPKTKEDLIQLGHGASGRSRVGGIIFLSITFLSILYALVVGILNIVAPGWMGES